MTKIGFRIGSVMSRKMRNAFEPSIDADHVYFGTEQGITAVRRDNGRVIWPHRGQHGANEEDQLYGGDRQRTSRAAPQPRAVKLRQLVRQVAHGPPLALQVAPERGLHEIAERDAPVAPVPGNFPE